VTTLDLTELRELRRDLQRIPPPYLIRKYEATEDDYEELADEDLRCEYLDGVLIVHSPASVEHEDETVFLTTLLNIFVSSRQLGRVYGSNTVMQLGDRRFCADINFLAAEHADRIRRRRVIGPVDLAVEVLSSSTRDYDLNEKRSAYREGRVPEIWLVDPDQRELIVDGLSVDSYESITLTSGRFESRVLTGLAVAVDWLWSDPLPNPLECLRSIGIPL
jgi:Uma2 family endonuclease